MTMVMAEDCAVHAQVLYRYPEGKAITPDAAHFCFPHGVQPSLLERTPSMSALNELVYSQHYQHSDGASFIFVLKASLGGHCALEQRAHLLCLWVHGSVSLLAGVPHAAENPCEWLLCS